MRKNCLYLAVGLTICFVAFASASKNSNLTSQLIGEWRNVYVKITLHNKTKPVQTMEADSTNWEARLGIKPIRTHFMEDGTYYSEYRNGKDSILRRPSGMWSIKGDSLTITQLKPDKSVLKVQVKISNDHATFSGLIDFDGEGVWNDEYFGIQKKFK
ncbi:hypothetical protein KXD93_09480 [Mucilaginibacter sp. BJC16-A38]|uniref:hypothetical protein n=1 Tax=Mucilaginibacter phenanthrenivorans TaxID=1234842 RepID=UPI002156F84A|nr:hypothetical protein [Mucilaginibacter phenanthrenivorans]MCR8557872.1 hypothetical protein [Mucilaginibacter phenanthrenivorans]